MALEDCVCPQGVLPTVEVDPCKIVMSKMRTMFFQKVATANNFVDATNDIILATSWALQLDSATDTKMSMVKNLKDVVFGATEVLEGSQNYDGAPTADESGPQLVTATLESPTPLQTDTIDQLACAARDGSLGVYFIDKNGKIQGNVVTDTPNPTYSGIPISQGTFVGKAPEKEADLGSKFQYMFQFYLGNDWYKNSRVLTPEDGFDPNTLAPTP